MRFSVVIPLYNKEAHIAEAVYSVLQQSYEQFELIVVDDGSNDGSADIVRQIEDKRLQLICKENGGTASARNRGILASQGDYICFLDADDRWQLNFLTLINSLINDFPGAGIYCTAYKFQRRRQLYHPGYYGLPGHRESFLVPDYLESVLWGEQIATASSACIPRRVLNEVGLFNEKIRHTEDQELWNRVVMKYPVAFHSAVGAIYRQDAQNMKTRHVPKQEIEYAACLQQQLDQGLIPEGKKEAVKKIIAANLIGVASLNLLAGDKKTARRFLNDPRSENLPQRKAAWEKLMPFPPFLIRAIYRLRNKIQNRR